MYINDDIKIKRLYLCNLHINIIRSLSLMDHCPKNWLDRELDSAHMLQIEEDLRRSPTMAKNQQPWIGIVDMDIQDITRNQARTLMKGCRITVIGGRHRHAAYRKVIFK